MIFRIEATKIHQNISKWFCSLPTPKRQLNERTRNDNDSHAKNVSSSRVVMMSCWCCEKACISSTRFASINRYDASAHQFYGFFRAPERLAKHPNIRMWNESSSLRTNLHQIQNMLELVSNGANARPPSDWNNQYTFIIIIVSQLKLTTVKRRTQHVICMERMKCTRQVLAISCF